MDYDVSVIGAGWAGFNAALAVTRSGRRACLIEDNEIGGACLNRGCIPTKTLLHHSKKNIPFQEILKKKTDIIARLRAGMAHLLKSSGVDYISGRALIEGGGRVRVGERVIASKFILIATGSAPADLPDLKFDHEMIISSDDALALAEVPAHLLIVGGGAIGCEFAFIFARLGAKVTVVELAGQLLPGVEEAAAKKVQASLVQRGVSVFTGKSFKDFRLEEFDKILLAVGRRARLEGLWDKKVDIRGENGFITVDERLRTSVPDIFAAGDCIGSPMLAHAASHEGELAAHNMFFRAPIFRDTTAVPSCIFTTPEVATIGLTEAQAQERGIDYRAATVSFMNIGMAHVLEETQGYLKAVVDSRSRLLLGATIVGAGATELVNIFCVLMRSRIPLTDVRNMMFSHPSLSEIIAETAKVFA